MPPVTRALGKMGKSWAENGTVWEILGKVEDVIHAHMMGTYPDNMIVGGEGVPISEEPNPEEHGKT